MPCSDNLPLLFKLKLNYKTHRYILYNDCSKNNLKIHVSIYSAAIVGTIVERDKILLKPDQSNILQLRLTILSSTARQHCKTSSG